MSLRRPWRASSASNGDEYWQKCYMCSADAMSAKRIKSVLKQNINREFESIILVYGLQNLSAKCYRWRRCSTLQRSDSVSNVKLGISGFELDANYFIHSHCHPISHPTVILK
jgi:hypothetical protein